MSKQLKFIPKHGQEYWYIGRRLRVDKDYYMDSSYGKQYIESGNCFETQEEAERVLGYVKPMFANQFNQEETVEAGALGNGITQDDMP